MVGVWAGLVLACVVLFGVVVRRLTHQLREESSLEHARQQFRFRREWLEVQFLSAIGKFDPIERLRWDEAHWSDDVVWARDRQTRRLLALVGVEFEPDGLAEVPGYPPRHATALFEYRKGHWLAEGKRLDEIHPDEAFLRSQRFEPVVFLPHRPA